MKRIVAIGLTLGLLLATSAAGAQSDSDVRQSIRASASIDALVKSFDYSNSKDAPVLRLYQAFFNRTPDVAGAKYWISVRRQGYNALRIAGFMSGSAEFKGLYDGTSDAEFVTAVYQNVLGRGYDQAGYDYWLGLVRRGELSRPAMVFYVTANQEFIRNYGFVNDGLENVGQSVGNGITAVGSLLSPGVFVNQSPGSSCYWARLSGFSGEFDDIIANDLEAGSGQVIMSVHPGDAGVEISRCGTFTSLASVIVEPQLTIGAGNWLVGDQVAPGRYVGIAEPGSCYWERQSDFGRDFESIAANAAYRPSAKQVVVDVLADDVVISVSTRCGDLAPVAQAALTARQTFGDGDWIVGQQIVPGTYVGSASAGTTCFASRVSDFSGAFDSLIAITSSENQMIITIEPSDAGVSLSGCQSMTRQ